MTRAELDDEIRDAERVCVELDGDAFHSARRSRDRDRRRDAALASIGWLTLRFSFNRLHNDIDGCRRDTLATLAMPGLTAPDWGWTRVRGRARLTLHHEQVIGRRVRLLPMQCRSEDTVKRYDPTERG